MTNATQNSAVANGEKTTALAEAVEKLSQAFSFQLSQIYSENLN